jgi:DNA-binding NarL/FixJ family response regulator
MSSGGVRLVIADDHPVVREGLRVMFSRFDDCEVVGEAGDGPEAVALARDLKTDVALVDLRLPGADGVAVARLLRAAAPEVAVLILSTFQDETAFLDALEAGARGYLLKDAAPDELHRAVLDCAAGGMPVDPALAPLLVKRDRRDDIPSRREREVLDLLAAGLANKEIADRLDVAESTVKTHLENIFRKFNVNDRTGAVTEGLRRGVIRLRNP